jgi:hypothetical protein
MPAAITSSSRSMLRLEQGMGKCATTKPRHLVPGLCYLSDHLYSRRQLTILVEAPANFTLPGLLHVA